MKAEEIIKRFAAENNITDIGICSAEPFEQLREELEKKAELLKGFVESDIEKRINPSFTLENAKSIIVIAVSYNLCFDRSDDGVLRGKISAGAVGEDYHTTVVSLLEKLAAELKKEYNFNYKAFADTGPLSDRAAAVRSGIGSRGKNGCVVAKNGGAAVFLGYMITDLVLEADRGGKNYCTDCGKCVAACPTGALNENGFDMTRCISYLTQLKRKLTEEEIRLIGGNIYGCDICQLVCPKNGTQKPWTGCKESYAPSVEELLKLSNRQFKELYGKTAIFWRGNTVIKRNALAAAANSGKKEAKKLIEPFLTSESVLLADTAEKALKLLDETER
jgi:epoxyqueuosine reductase